MRFLLLLSVLAASCATAPEGPPQYDGPEVVLSEGVWDFRDGVSNLGEPEFLQALSEYDFIVLGESHDSVEDHAMQARVYSGLIELGARPALGMEMFQRPFQPILDAYVAGDIEEERMLAETEYEARWGFDPNFYSPLWQAARAAGLPVVALNVRRELTKRVSAVGVDGLSETERADLPELVFGPDAYRNWLGQVFAAHGMSTTDARFERFFQAQVLWDETMADSAVRAWSEQQPVVIIVGRGHVERGWGIPSRIKRRLPNARVATVVTAPAGTAASEVFGLADFIVSTRAPSS